MRLLTIHICALLLLLASPAVAEYCKWVDEEGVTHYAETCPDDVETTGVELQKPPSEKQVEEAIRRSSQLQAGTSIEPEEASEEAPVFVPRYTREQLAEREKARHRRQCEQWRMELERLEKRHEWHEIQIDLKKLLHVNNCD